MQAKQTTLIFTIGRWTY